MDAMRNLAGGEGCTVDGAAAAANPLSQFVNQAMGARGPKGQRQGFAGPGAARGPRGRPQNAMERGFAQGMGLRGANVQRGADFAREFNVQHQGPPSMTSGESMMRAGARNFGTAPQQQQQWVNDFGNMSVRHQRMGNFGVQPRMRPPMGFQAGAARGWANDMANGPSAMEKAWTEARREDWAKELSSVKPDEDMEATRRATSQVADLMSQNPKFKNSQFGQFMKEVSAGDVTFKDNEVVREKESVIRDTFEDLEEQQRALEDMFSKTWEDTLNGKEVDVEKAYRDAMSRFDRGVDVQAMNSAWEGASKHEFADMESRWLEHNAQTRMPYQMAQENKFQTENPHDAYAKGLAFFKEGLLSDAILAFESVVTQDPNHADAWRYLGLSHQENDEDKQAILCLERAVDVDPYHLDALLGLGVSYVNELSNEKALEALKAWVLANPRFQGMDVKKDVYGDGSLLDDVVNLMLRCREHSPRDANVLEVLGVLYNVSRDFDAAASCFRDAVNARPDDYALWNKLGATLANGSKSEDAVPAYHRALELKPRYARGYLNLGISHSNLGSYLEAARCYLKALELNPRATHIWSYLRIAFTVAERFDLVTLTDGQDIEAFRAEFKF